MPYQATLFIETELPIPMKVADAATITQGDFLKMTDPFTVAATAGALDVFGGIAAEDKSPNNGVTTIAVYRTGYFKVYLSGSATVGDGLSTDSVVNMVKSTVATAPALISGSRLWGIAMETGTTGETIIAHIKAGIN